MVRTKMLPDVRFPIESETPYPFYALLETQGSRKEHDDEVQKNRKGFRTGASWLIYMYTYTYWI